jgi:N-acetylmuramoyl-L-alanine amidase
MFDRLARLAHVPAGRWTLAGAVALCLVAAALSHTAAAAGPSVTKVRFGGTQAETRIVIELDRATVGRLETSPDADQRIILTLADLQVAGDLQGSGQGLVKGWMMDQAGGAARLRLDLAGPASVKRRFLLPPSEGSSAYRYVVDIVSSSSGSATAPVSTITPVSTVAPVVVAKPALLTPVSVKAPSPVLLPPAPSVRAVPVAVQKATSTPRPYVAPLRLKKVIVIDAGHGGHDPGARGSAANEKDINLAAALGLKERLDRSGRYKVILTRDKDVFIPLENRVQVARHANADLFISLHSDSGPNSQTRGASVYTLSDKGSDRVARNALEKNNWFHDVNLPAQDKAVKQILLDLTQRATKNRSASFAQLLLTRIDDHVQLLARSHRDAGFVVLLAPDVPAVLLEMGFITNLEDEALLANRESRQDFMDSVGDSIDAYFDEELRIASR